MIELLSIDTSNYCSKQCSFCYNHSRRDGNTLWSPEEIISFASDCIDNGIKAVSLGGGEPFEYDGIFNVIAALYPKCYLSVTTNGLPLENMKVWNQLVSNKPDKIHVTIHQPQCQNEIDRVERLVKRIGETGIKPGLNLLVGADKAEYARAVYTRFRQILELDQIIIIPQRFSNTPTPKQLAFVAGGRSFQSPSCILGCKRPMNFVSVSWDKKVSSCSYAPNKMPLKTLDFRGLSDALKHIIWMSCHDSGKNRDEKSMI